MSESVQDRFQTRDEIVSFIEQQATTAVEKAAQDIAARRAARALGHQRADRPRFRGLQRSQSGRVRARIRRRRPGQGRSPRSQSASRTVSHLRLRAAFVGRRSFLVPIATNHLPAFDSKGARLRDEIRQKMTAHADRFDLDEANWINRKLGIRTKAAGHAERFGRRVARAVADARRVDRPAAQSRGIRCRRGPGSGAATERPVAIPKAHRRLDGLLGRRGIEHHGERAEHRQPRFAGEEARRLRQSEQRAGALLLAVRRRIDPLRHGPRGGAQGGPGDARRHWRHADQRIAHLFRHLVAHGFNGRRERQHVRSAGRRPHGKQAARRRRDANRLADAQDDVCGPDESPVGRG